MGLLTDSGQVFLLYADHADATAFEKTKEHAGEKVAITGIVSEQGGLSGVEVHNVKPL